MLYTKKFVITVSLCAMLAANPVLAVTNPVTAAAGAFSGEVGKVGTVYSDWAGRADSGIAGVTYVNNAVDAAGNAAQWAENHAAAAAQSAKSAADSASDAAKVLQKAVLRPDDAANEENAVGSKSLPVYVMADGTVDTITSYEGKAATAGTADKAIADQNGDQIDKTYEKLGNKVAKLSADSTDIQYPNAKLVYTELGKKVDKDQGEDYKNLAMVTDQKGTVYPGYVDTDMIADNAVTVGKIEGNNSETCYTSSGGTICSRESAVLVSDDDGAVSWGLIDGQLIANGAVTTDKIADDAVTFGKIKGYQDSNYEPTTGKLLIGGENSFGWGSIHPAMITSPGDSSVTGLSGLAIVSDGEGNTYWGQVSKYGIEDEAVTSDKIADGAVSEDKLYSYGQNLGVVLLADGKSGAEWGQVGNSGIADGAVTFRKIKGYQDGDYEPTTGKLLIGGEDYFGWGSIHPDMITSPKGDPLQTGLSGLAIVSDGEGNSYWGQVSKYGIENAAVTNTKIAARAVSADKMVSPLQHGGLVLVAGDDSSVEWGQIGSGGIASGAVTTVKIADGAVSIDKIGVGGYYDDHLGQTVGGAVVGDVMVASNGEAVWSKIKPENTAGVVGMVPEGSPDATTYSQMWIE